MDAEKELCRFALMLSFHPEQRVETRHNCPLLYSLCTAVCPQDLCHCSPSSSRMGAPLLPCGRPALLRKTARCAAGRWAAFFDVPLTNSSCDLTHFPLRAEHSMAVALIVTLNPTM